MTLLLVLRCQDAGGAINGPAAPRPRSARRMTCRDRCRPPAAGSSGASAGASGRRGRLAREQFLEPGRRCRGGLGCGGHDLRDAVAADGNDAIEPTRLGPGDRGGAASRLGAARPGRRSRRSPRSRPRRPRIRAPPAERRRAVMPPGAPRSARHGHAGDGVVLDHGGHPRRARARRDAPGLAPLPVSSGAPVQPVQRAATASGSPSALAGRTVISASPCQTATRGQGPRMRRGVAHRRGPSAAGGAGRSPWPRRLPASLHAAPCGRPARMAPAAKTSG